VGDRVEMRSPERVQRAAAGRPTVGGAIGSQGRSGAPCQWPARRDGGAPREARREHVMRRRRCPAPRGAGTTRSPETPCRNCAFLGPAPKCRDRSPESGLRPVQGSRRRSSARKSFPNRMARATIGTSRAESRVIGRRAQASRRSVFAISRGAVPYRSSQAKLGFATCEIVVSEFAVAPDMVAMRVALEQNQRLADAITERGTKACHTTTGIEEDVPRQAHLTFIPLTHATIP